MFIDTHCHLNFSDFDQEIKNIARRCQLNDEKVINIGVDQKSSQGALRLAKKYNNMWAVIGTHPLYIERKNSFQFLEKLIKKEKVVGIGEVGLDYHHFSAKEKVKEIEKRIERQKNFLKQAIILANQNKKPLVFHLWGSDKKIEKIIGKRKVYAEFLEIIKDFPIKQNSILHSFIGNYKIAKIFIEKGFYIGLNGIITYSNSYDKLIKKIGISHIVLETDSPYLTPLPLDKKEKNNPCNIKYVAQKIAQVLNLSVEKVARETSLNAQKIFFNDSFKG